MQSAIEFCMTAALSLMSAALSLMSRRVTCTIFLKIDSKLKVSKQTWILGTVSVESKDIRPSSGLYLDLLCSMIVYQEKEPVCSQLVGLFFLHITLMSYSL